MKAFITPALTTAPVAETIAVLHAGFCHYANQFAAVFNDLPVSEYPLILAAIEHVAASERSFMDSDQIRFSESISCLLAPTPRKEDVVMTEDEVREAYEPNP